MIKIYLFRTQSNNYGTNNPHVIAILYSVGIGIYDKLKFIIYFHYCSQTHTKYVYNILFIFSHQQKVSKIKNMYLEY